MEPKICLALGGGAARGLAHLGVLKVFEDAHVPIHMISGTSLGALMPAVRANVLPRTETPTSRCDAQIVSVQIR